MMNNQNERGGVMAAPTATDREVEAALAVIITGTAAALASEDAPIDEVYHALAGGLLAAQEMISWRWHGEQPPLAAAQHVARLILAALPSQPEGEAQP